MRHALIALTLALSPVVALAANLSVPLDQSLRLTMASSVHDVIVGNPKIADVAVADDHHLIVTGKNIGVTNLIVTDQRGRTILDRELVVHTGGAGGSVTLIAGATATDYACAPTCETTIVPPAPDSPPQQSFTVTTGGPAPASGGASPLQPSPTVP
jgi:hypothetical protein